VGDAGCEPDDAGVNTLRNLRERWRYLAWFDVKRARLWQGVICVGVVAVMGVILGLLMWSL